MRNPTPGVQCCKEVAKLQVKTLDFNEVDFSHLPSSLKKTSNFRTQSGTEGPWVNMQKDEMTMDASWLQNRQS